ncbi:c-type cytochrome [Occallatibacter savannae]|uniref:c-type cytochrome n=1 Tax=Occallatibacter savannae TaxID=1002691 RepID=UPI000D688560|nr:cytochrome C [Occallatibacter savannae]
MTRLTSATAFFAVLLLLGCSRLDQTAQHSGSQRSAPELMEQYGCPTCHVIPNVPGAVGKVGPSLRSLAQRSYLAGSIPNTPENLVQWIMHPQHFRPGTAMPEMGVSSSDAQRIATFLNENR